MPERPRTSKKVENPMERHELEQWLCGPDVPPPSPASIANALGLPSAFLADTTFVRAASRVRSLRLTLAVLRDAFADDADIRRWLETPLDEIDGCSPAHALRCGRCELVETLAVRTWNDTVCLSEAV
jgi:hypothetical protein